MKIEYTHTLSTYSHSPQLCSHSLKHPTALQNKNSTVTFENTDPLFSERKKDYINGSFYIYMNIYIY